MNRMRRLSGAFDVGRLRISQNLRLQVYGLLLLHRHEIALCVVYGAALLVVVVDALTRRSARGPVGT